MASNKINSLILTLIVLASALIWNPPQNSSDDVVLSAPVEPTSLTATVESAAPEVLPEPPKITAASALVKALDANQATFSFNPNQQWPVASLTKLMTALVAVENIAADAKIRVSENAVATEGNAGNLIAGRVYSLGQLLHALLKVSSNDAAAALAEFVGKEKFLELMNEKAVRLGMYNTRYFDPTGLSALNQSMASDLEKLVLYIFNQHPEIFAITREKDGNLHPFASRENFVGGKTGFIDEASGNLISLFNINGRPLLIIVLGSEDRAKDTEILYAFYAK